MKAEITSPLQVVLKIYLGKIMSPKTLPDEVAAKLREIRKKYKVAFEKLRFGTTELEILTVQDLEPLLKGKDPFKDVSEFPFWVRLWESAMMLGGLMASGKPEPGETLLEIGAGLGAPGLAAAAAGYQVTLSDYEKIILDFQKVNAAASGLPEVKFRHIDWMKPPAMEPFDKIVGAEVLFRDDFFEPLLNLFSKLLKPGGVIFLAHDARRKSLPKFLEMAEKDYVIATKSNTLKSDEDEITIIINRLQRRSE